MADTVLIVDDHERFRASARRALEADGWTVLGEASNGESGLLAARDIDPDVVVLLDVGLPDMSGLEVARLLHERAPELAVVLVSTQDAADYRVLAQENGARGFMTKSDLSGEALDALLHRSR
jgi:DNA-binding NarL/FixJ family response regulator